LHSELQVCFYRDKNSLNRFIICTVTSAGVFFDEPIAVATTWNYKVMQNPTKWTPGAW
jgi:20S proteasome subunit beta 7